MTNRERDYAVEDTINRLCNGWIMNGAAVRQLRDDEAEAQRTVRMLAALLLFASTLLAVISIC